MHAQLGDQRQKIGFADDYWVHIDGPQAIFDVKDEAIYFAFGLRNVGSGIAIIQGWSPHPERLIGTQAHPPVEEFRAQTRALYVPPGGLGFWQGALRDRGEPAFADFEKDSSARQPITIDLLYSDMNGGQRTVTRFAVLPGPLRERGDDGDDTPSGRWIASIGTHWLIDDHAGR